MSFPDMSSVQPLTFFEVFIVVLDKNSSLLNQFIELTVLWSNTGSNMSQTICCRKICAKLFASLTTLRCTFLKHQCPRFLVTFRTLSILLHQSSQVQQHHPHEMKLTIYLFNTFPVYQAGWHFDINQSICDNIYNTMEVLICEIPVH